MEQTKLVINILNFNAMKNIIVKFLYDHIWQPAKTPDYINDYDDLVNWAAWTTKTNNYMNFWVLES